MSDFIAIYYFYVDKSICARRLPALSNGTSPGIISSRKVTADREISPRDSPEARMSVRRNPAYHSIGSIIVRQLEADDAIALKRGEEVTSWALLHRMPLLSRSI